MIAYVLRSKKAPRDLVISVGRFANGEPSVTIAQCRKGGNGACRQQRAHFAASDLSRMIYRLETLRRDLRIEAEAKKK